jgi:hypothetical protein
MIRYLVVVILLSSCIGKTVSNESSQKDSILSSDPSPIAQYDRLKEYLFSSDSVVLLSHHSPNMPIRNLKTGKYYQHPIPFIEDGKINYSTSVQERKQINKNEIRELADILTLPAVDDSILTMCFQPRNAVVAFKKDQMSCFDFCFDCFGFSKYGNFDSELIMNVDKYKKLIAFYKKHGFKYEME